MTKLSIDGIEVDVPPHFTLLQAIEAAGIEVPRFCYHDRLSIAGNCRMCLVEVKGGPPKPQASCALGVRDIRPGPNGEPPVVLTKSPMVKKAREGVMEFLLINHPLDCPICDQGGECDLQDQAMAYGGDRSRYHEDKRAVEDKYLGPLVKTEMTRCIQCTRCVRFTTEVAGVSELGAIGRGEDMEITSYLEKALSSEMQANVVDLCPVGALTAKPHASTYRAWEFTKTESIDVMDALGSAIRVDTRGREVMRVLPRVNDAINEEWISDKTRHVADGLRTQRLDRPYVRENGRLRAASWDEAFRLIATKVAAAKPERIGALAGQLAGVEEMFALKALMASLGSRNIDSRYPGSPLHTNNGRASYIFNSTIAGIDEADALLLIGCNPRTEATVLNARIRKRWLRGDLLVGVIGEQADLTYTYHYFGAGPASIAEFAKTIKGDKKKPMVIIGQGALNRADGGTILAEIARLAGQMNLCSEGWNGLNILHTEAAAVGALDIGFVPDEGGQGTTGILDPSKMDVIYNLGADEIEIPAGPFVIYQGTHGDKGAHRADVILPGAAYTEKSATYVNTEGRVQMTTRAGFAPGDAREDWAILRALSAHLGKTLPFDNLPALRRALYDQFPHLAAIGHIKSGDTASLAAIATWGGTIDKAPFVSPIKDFYLTNPILRASTVMAECSALAKARHAVAAE